LTLTPVFEDDGHFTNLPATPLAHEQHLDQERVSTGENVIERD
jgi:hypothetical protein